MYTSPRGCHEAKAIYMHRWYKTLLSCPCSIHTAYCKGFSRNSKGKCSPFEVGLSVHRVDWLDAELYIHTYTCWVLLDDRTHWQRLRPGNVSRTWLAGWLPGGWLAG